MPLLFASPAIPPGGEIPSQYTCDSTDISPPLTWSEAPDGTKSLVLVIEDPDAPLGIPPLGCFRHSQRFTRSRRWLFRKPASQGFERGA